MTHPAPANVIPIARSVASDPGYLSELADQINVCLKKSDDYRLTVALKLAEAKAACKKDRQPFKSWVNRNIEMRYSHANELALIGAGPTQSGLDDCSILKRSRKSICTAAPLLSTPSE